MHEFRLKGSDNMKKFALALIACSAAIFGTGLVVNADYPPGAGSVTATPATVAPGGIFSVTATCQAGESVTFTFNTDSKVRNCNNDNTESVTFNAPTAAGSYDGTAVGGVNGVLGSFTVTVAITEPPVTQGGATNGGTTGAASTLPSTGSGSTSTGLIIGVGSLLVGLGLFVTARTRRHQELSAGAIG
jgi:LPXTG-motif cell wall-anchored protein